MMEINESLAYLTAPSGKRYQVLLADGSGWDEAATKAAYEAGEAAPAAAPKVEAIAGEASAGA